MENLWIFLQMLIEASTDKDGIIDPFMGTGSTIEACIRPKRNYIGIEINKEFYKHTEKIVFLLFAVGFFLILFQPKVQLNGMIALQYN